MNRIAYLQQIIDAFKVTPIVALLGPRQCGKTTLARAYVASYPDLPLANYFDLEDPDDLMRLSNPKLTLSGLENLIILDEIQCLPNIFPLLRVLVDNPQLNQKYLILGSASRELLRQSSETLAGRISYIEITPFSYGETEDLNTLWFRGGFPRSYLAEDQNISFQWRKQYIRTFLEHDIQRMGIQVSPENLRRFWMMLVNVHGNLFNASELARSLNLSQPTIRHYLDILSHTFMLRELKPWFENISKRQIKSPKIYFRDSGILHTLLGFTNQDELRMHPKLGASWEGFALETVIRITQAESVECYFWATHADAELDLLIVKDGKKIGFEFKYSDMPRMTKSMHIAIHDLKLDRLIIVHPGNQHYQPKDNVFVLGLADRNEVIRMLTTTY